MPSRLGSIVATCLFALLASGCSTVKEAVVPGASGPDVIEVTMPAGAGARNALVSTKAVSASLAEGGLAALLHAQGAITLGGGKNEPVGTVRLSKKRVKAEVDGVLDAARDGHYDKAARIFVSGGDVAQLAKFFKAYFEAYFRKFEFIEGPGGIITESKETFFYNRAGQKFGFPTITIAFDPKAAHPLDVTKIDEIELIGDLTRVTIEALADAFSPDVFADPKSTGCVHKILTNCVDTAKPEVKQLKCVMGYADKTEALSGYVAAVVVRGGWWAALNNEALAKAFQVGASVTFRKIAENAAMGPGICPPSATMARIGETATLRVLLVE